MFQTFENSFLSTQACRGFDVNLFKFAKALTFLRWSPKCFKFLFLQHLGLESAKKRVQEGEGVFLILSFVMLYYFIWSGARINIVC